MASEHTSRCLIVCVFDFWPFLSLKGKPPSFRVEGTMPEVIQVVARKLDLCFEYAFPKDRRFGSELPNGSWTGMMGQLLRREADMSGVVFSQQEARARAVDFSEPLYINDHVLSYHRPQLEPDITGFVKPYTSLVWVLLLMTMVAVFVCAFFVQLYHANFLRHEGPDRAPSKMGEEAEMDETTGRGDLAGSVWTSVLWTLAFPLAQSIPWRSQGDSLRFLAGLWLLMAFIVGTVYRSNLKAMLILPKLHLPFNNIDELSESGLTVFAGIANLVTNAITDASPGSQLHSLQKQLRIDANIHEGLRRLSYGIEVAFVNRMLMYYIIDRHFTNTGECKHYIAGESYLGATSLSLAFPKSSPLKEKIDPVLRNLKEFGILDHILMKGLPNLDKCIRADSARTNNDLRPLELGDFYGIFCVYAGGVVVAVVVFLFEMVSTYVAAQSKQTRRSQ